MNGWAQNFADGIVHHRELEAVHHKHLAKIDDLDQRRGGNLRQFEDVPTPEEYDAELSGIEADMRREIANVVTANLSDIMDMYLPEQLQVMSGLARSYGVSDVWFCSVPSQTNTNRAFWAAGTAMGLVTNCWYDAFKSKLRLQYYNPVTRYISYKGHGSHSDELPAGTKTVFDVLGDEGIELEVLLDREPHRAPILPTSDSGHVFFLLPAGTGLRIACKT